MVSNDEGIHIVVLGQVRISILELANLFGIQDMDVPLVASQCTVLSEGIDQAVAVDGGSFHADGDFLEL